MTESKNKDQTEVRTQIANDLRQRAEAVHSGLGQREGTDSLTDRLFNAMTAGAGARGLAMEAYSAIADLIENGTTR